MIAKKIDNAPCKSQQHAASFLGPYRKSTILPKVKKSIWETNPEETEIRNYVPNDVQIENWTFNLKLKDIRCQHERQQKGLSPGTFEHLIWNWKI